MEVTFLLFFVIFVIFVVNLVSLNWILSFQYTWHLLHLRFIVLVHLALFYIDSLVFLSVLSSLLIWSQDTYS